MKLPTDEQVWREGIHSDLASFAEDVERQAVENHRYFKDFNIALFEIKQRILLGNVAVCILLCLILWRVW